MELKLKLKDCRNICDFKYDGQQALDLIMEDATRNRFRSSSYDLILMDLNMPVMDGFMATQKIRKFLSDKKMNQPLIVAATGHAEQGYVQAALEYGMDDVIQKPIQVESLEKVF